MSFEIVELAKAWDKVIKGRKIKMKISGAQDSEMFFTLVKALLKVKVKKDKHKWVRNE